VSYETLTVTKEEQIATVRLNRPERRNALNATLTRELSDALGEIAGDGETRVIILTGGDEVFSVGADIKEMTSGGRRGLALRRRAGVFDMIEQLDRVVIAAIAGYAVGGGLELALVCDLRVAATNAKLGLPEIKLGVVPAAGGTQRLPRLIGAARAKELMLTGEFIGAEQAKEMGLINRVVEPAALMDESLSLARAVAEMPPLAARAVKSCVNAGMEMSLEAALEYEARVGSILTASEDRAEGMRAFVEKRKPVFKGR
jgi:enoyl-CoA hydratase